MAYFPPRFCFFNLLSLIVYFLFSLSVFHPALFSSPFRSFVLPFAVHSFLCLMAFADPFCIISTTNFYMIFLPIRRVGTTIESVYHESGKERKADWKRKHRRHPHL